MAIDTEDLNTNSEQPLRKLSVVDFIEDKITPETAEKLRTAEEVFGHRVEHATNGVLDGVQRVLDSVPNKYVATGLLALGETIGFGGYGVSDALTLLSGVRDIAEGRYLESDEKNRAMIRGGLKIVGALTPVIPSFWVEPVLKVAMPIPSIDKAKK